MGMQLSDTDVSSGIDRTAEHHGEITRHFGDGCIRQCDDGNASGRIHPEVRAIHAEAPAEARAGRADGQHEQYPGVKCTVSPSER